MFELIVAAFFIFVFVMTIKNMFGGLWSRNKKTKGKMPKFISFLLWIIVIFMLVLVIRFIF
ncbi:MAG: hypothetical protein J6A15_02090 [Clostridia bacterium]|nr:hypothetical protein [Clostridia bacterium]